MRSRPDPTVLAALTGLLLLSARLDLLPALRGPAPWPPEWQWGFAPRLLDAAAGPAALLLALLVFLLAASGHPLLARRPRWLVATACLAGAVLPAALLAPVDRPVRELLRRTVHGSFTSYHKVATSAAAADPGVFVAQHARLLPTLRRGTPHAATHPPGPVLHYRAWLALAQVSPRLTDEVVARLRTRHGVDPGALVPAQTGPGLVAALLGAGTLLALVGCVPLLAAALARELGAEPLPAARVALLSPLLPGLALMTPELDQALAVPVLLVALGLARCARSAVAGPLLVGLSGGLAAFFSYGVPALAAPGALGAVAARTPPWRRVVAATALAAGVFLLPLLVGHDPLASLRQGLALHREAFTAPRSYLSWLAWNPLDVAIFAGPALVVLLIVEARGARSRFARVVGLAVLLLLASGTVRGEAGRILVPVLPVMLVAGAATWTRAAPPAAALGALLAAVALGLRLCWALP